MSLSDLKCRHAKPQTKPYRLFDSGGLYLDILPSHKRVWRFKYKFYGKERLLTIGHYPQMSLVDARQQRDIAKQSVSEGVDPARQKQLEKENNKFKQHQTVELVSREWHAKFYERWTKNYGDQILRYLEANLFPEIGSIPFSKITIQDILACMEKIQERGRKDLAHRILSLFGQIMRYAVITSRAERDLTRDLRGALVRSSNGHFASIKPDELPGLNRAIEENKPRLFRQTVLALKLIMLTFVRTKELIEATWEEFDLDKAIWIIPAERMKMRRQHIVPLSRQVLIILHELQESFGNNGYILPSVIRSNKGISSNTILNALAKLGYHKTMTGHGFRALAMTTIKERLHYRHDVIDRQLAHFPKSKVTRAYDRAEYLNERTIMMQDWADYVEVQSVSSR